MLGFGGGVSELLLMLAKAEGHRAFFCSGNPARRTHLEAVMESSREATVALLARRGSKLFRHSGIHYLNLT